MSGNTWTHPAQVATKAPARVAPPKHHASVAATAAVRGEHALARAAPHADAVQMQVLAYPVYRGCTARAGKATATSTGEDAER